MYFTGRLSHTVAATSISTQYRDYQGSEMWTMVSTDADIFSLMLKGGLNPNAIFPPLDMGLMGISRSRFKQSKNSMLIL